MEPLIKILSASAELFRQYGFKTITMDDIARRAGISKKTLYQHFSNKNEVVNQSVTWYKNKVTELCQTAMSQSANAIEGMVRTMDMFDQINRQINPMAMLELERFYPEGFQRFKASLLEQDVEAIKGNIVQGMQEGYYREDINPDFMARYRMELSLIIFHPTFLVNDRHEMHIVAHEISEHFLYGIMTPKGEKLYQKYKEKYLKQVSKV
jgi:TetR/AcrR family transcriptional regulator, cholesterol catabolism regulator